MAAKKLDMKVWVSLVVDVKLEHIKAAWVALGSEIEGSGNRVHSRIEMSKR